VIVVLRLFAGLILRSMRAIITVFKDELTTKPLILNSIREMSSDVSEVGDAFTFSPKPGKLFELLNLLKNSAVAYGTHFHVADGNPSVES
jgi:hypothetical protein